MFFVENDIDDNKKSKLYFICKNFINSFAEKQNSHTR